jgi:hypothetical protein
MDKITGAMMRAFKAKDAAEVEKIAEEVKDAMEEEGITQDEGEAEGGDTHVHVHASGNDTAGVTAEEFAAHQEQNENEHAEMRSRIEALEQLIAGGQTSGATGDEDPEAKKDEKEATGDSEEELEEAIKDEFPEDIAEKAAKANDSAYFADTFQDTVAMAEILVPGIRIPTYDRAAKPGQTFKKICGLRKQALDIAFVQPATRSILEELLGGKTLDTKNMTCDAARVLFRSAATAQRTANNAGKGRSADANVQPKGPVSIAEINKRNRERFPN